MKFTRRLIATAVLALTLTLGFMAAPPAQAYQEGSYTFHYALQHDTGEGSAFYRLVVRHCLTEDDWGAGLRVVDGGYRPHTSTVIIRCRRH